MNVINFSPREILTVIFIWWISFLLLGISSFGNVSIVQTIIGFSFLILVPGFLTEGILKLRPTIFAIRIFLIIGISLLELIVLGLFSNTVMPVIGIDRPLDVTALATLGSLFLFVLGIIYYKRSFKLPRLNNFLFDLPSRQGLILSLVPLSFVLLMSGGAAYLNAGGTGFVTTLTLIGMAVYLVFLFKSPVDNDSVIVTAIYFISLALLLMTSLRGDYVIGHDIQREFAVFQLAKYHGIWSIDLYRDAYNACLSITMLPTLFSNLLAISDQYIYKVLFQIIFAVVPGIFYVLVRQFVVKEVALTSAFFFVSFATFFTDMPFLIRQEIAFVFLALMFLSMFGKSVIGNRMHLLPFVFGLGIVLSHYSTTYTVIMILGFTLVTQFIINIIKPHLPKVSSMRFSVMYDLSSHLKMSQQKTTLILTVFLMMASLIWGSLITDTSSNSLFRVVGNTVAAIQTPTWEGTYSDDVKYSFLSSKETDKKVLLTEYQEEIVAPTRESAPEGVFYDEVLYAEHPIRLIERDKSSLTGQGKILSAIGVDVSSSQDLVKQFFAKSIQLLIMIGFVGAFFSIRNLTRPLNMHFMLVAAGNLLMVVAIVVVPLLSIEYGVLRAFQQSLMFLGLFVSIGLLTLCFKCETKTANNILIGFATVFFLSSTGVLGGVLGGVEQPLHLSNSGLYYDQYYIQEGEKEGLVWLAKETEGRIVDIQSEMQIDPKVFTEMTHIIDSNPLNTIYPELIRQDSYVYLSYANVHNRQASIVINDVYVTYEYPIEFLDSVKELVFDNGVVRIYR